MRNDVIFANIWYCVIKHYRAEEIFIPSDILIVQNRP